MAKMNSKKKSRKGINPAAIIIAAALVVLIAAGIVLGPRLIHTCDNCGKLIIGTGYRANVVTNAISTITGRDTKVICRACAEKQHAISIAAGASLDDFRLPLFPEK